MLSFPRKSSRKGNKKDAFSSQTITKNRPGLAVDTSFSRHRGTAPEQVFPQAKPEETRFISLQDIYSLGDDAPPVPAKTDGTNKQQLNSSVYISSGRQPPQLGQTTHSSSPLTNALGISQNKTAPSAVEQTLAPSTSLVHKRIHRLRPSPLELSSEVSPSDRAIPIGIEVSPSSLSQSRTRATPLKLGVDTQQSGKELPTPTIVITPAREDFEGPFTSPDDIFIRSNARPTSSVYSRYTNGAVNGRTPPVPPLPLFAAQSNASLRQTTFDASQSANTDRGIPHGRSSRSRSVLSLQTVFEEPNTTESRYAVNRNSRRLTMSSVTSRRSKGWWNVLTSPFSPSGLSPGAFLRSPPADDNSEEREPILSDASSMARSKLSDIIMRSREAENDELRSAPSGFTTDDNERMTRKTPQRSDTAPGALDRGNADKLNIYRQPSKGAARSYFDLRDSMIDKSKIITSNRSLAEEGWSPSQSVYRPSVPAAGLRDSQFYTTPDTGAAATYYDSNKRFPSLPPDGLDGRDNGWDPRNSVAHPENGHHRGVTDLSGFPMNSMCDGSRTPTNRASTIRAPPYPDNTNPLNDSQTAHYDDLGLGGPKAYFPDLTPSSGDVSAFKDFSATHPAASFPETPDVRLSLTNPRPEASRNNSEDVFSPLLETPLVEEARTATLMGPETHREVEVASAKLRRTPPAYGAGLGDATMASQVADDVGYARSIDSTSDDAASDWDQHERPKSQAAGFGYLAGEHARSIEEPSQGCSEKPYTSRSNLRQGEGEDQAAGTPWYRRFSRVLIAIVVLLLLGLLALLLVLFVPRHDNEQPVEAAWLNLTGFPPLPTGVVTVINPKAVQEVDGCTAQQGLWSCALPSDDTSSASGVHATPNFRFQILFRNNILPSNETAIQPSNITLSRRSLGHASGASDLARRGIFTSPLWQSAPAAPSSQDQDFLGRTTDKNTAPYNGEQTPFYITLMNASALTNTQSSHGKRDFHYPYPNPKPSNSNSNSTSPHNISLHQLNGTSSKTNTAVPNIPHAATTNNGYPAPATLYPFAYAQPLRLFNRGLSSEHYGFYTYFDRTLYISSAGTVGNSSGVVTSNTPLDSSTAVCTWSQTRLLVQIWTQKSDVSSLNATANGNIPILESTANDMQAPGSFPYSVTVTLDRHGGNAGEKGVYCHSLDGEHRVLQDVRTWVVENRSFGGNIIKPGPVPSNDGTIVSINNNGNAGGIDGGNGGCSCSWQNW